MFQLPFHVYDSLVMDITTLVLALFFFGLYYLLKKNVRFVRFPIDLFCHQLVAVCKTEENLRNIQRKLLLFRGSLFGLISVVTGRIF